MNLVQRKSQQKLYILRDCIVHCNYNRQVYLYIYYRTPYFIRDVSDNICNLTLYMIHKFYLLKYTIVIENST